jgi:predicted aspartyl protease
VALDIRDTYLAQYHALMALNQTTTKKRAEQILASLEGEKLPEQLKIPLSRLGNQFVAEVVIENNPARMLLDTGASLSGLSKDYTAKYPHLLKSQKPIRLNTASGSVESMLFTVDNLSLGALNFNQHIFAQLPMSDAQGFDGLLGVDILGRFDFVIDQNAAVLTLKARKKE